MKDKKEVIGEVRDLITAFADKRLSEEELTICVHILEKLGRKQKIDITRTRADIWASAIVWSFCRANFKYEQGISLDVVCSFFETSKRTVGTKASEISKMFRIDFFNPEFTTAHIQLENPLNQLRMTRDGFVVPKDMFIAEDDN